MVNVVNIFKALSDETRINIILNLHARGGSSRCAELSTDFDLSQPTMSHHYQKLIQAEIITPTKKGTCMSYELNYNLLNKYGFDITKLQLSINKENL